MLIFSQTNWLRRRLKAILVHPYFENFIYYVIAFNCLTLVLGQPAVTDPSLGSIYYDQYQEKTINIFSNIISAIFILEAIWKIIVMGFAYEKHAYLKDPFNVLDFIIVLFSILNWILETQSDVSITWVKGFRALRALRPLRMVSKNDGK